MGRRLALFIALVALAIVGAARSGHELPVYPSYYPHEIDIRAVAADEAGRLIAAGKMQAYVGGAPSFGGAPAPVRTVASLGELIVARVNRESRWGGSDALACAAVQTLVRDLAAKRVDMIPHPYPVTPFHGDYLHHFDRAESAWKRFLEGPPDADAPAITELKVRVDGTVAARLVHASIRAGGPDWDIELSAVDAAVLIGRAENALNGWLGPAWLKAGWFHAHLLLGWQVDAGDLRRLQAGDFADAAARINLERGLVASLVAGCRVLVVGYTVKRESYNAEFSAGIENIAYDSITGLQSPMFIRTVKLKDFPWNGWLSLGVAGSAGAAWNPIAGFSDWFGRLLWSAVGDPASLPSPNGSDWVSNRVTDVDAKPRR
jgi:hypothetical protein